MVGYSSEVYLKSLDLQVSSLVGYNVLLIFSIYFHETVKQHDVMMTLRHRAIKPFLDVENDVYIMFVKLFRSPRSPKLQVLNRVNIPILQRANNGLIYFKVKVSNMTENVRQSRETKKNNQRLILCL